jgi:CheY-like chemotaxis protein
MLESFGYEVTNARDGNEAVKLYKEAKKSDDPFKIVIMDLTIPGGMGGKETIKILKEFDPEIKAIVSSGYSNDPVMSNFRDFGFCGVTAKPYRLKELEEVLVNVESS